MAAHSRPSGGYEPHQPPEFYRQIQGIGIIIPEGRLYCNFTYVACLLTQMLLYPVKLQCSVC